jgi:hypothetical protein
MFDPSPRHVIIFGSFPIKFAPPQLLEAPRKAIRSEFRHIPTGEAAEAEATEEGDQLS